MFSILSLTDVDFLFTALFVWNVLFTTGYSLFLYKRISFGKSIIRKLSLDISTLFLLGPVQRSSDKPFYLNPQQLHARRYISSRFEGSQTTLNRLISYLFTFFMLLYKNKPSKIIRISMNRNWIDDWLVVKLMNKGFLNKWFYKFKTLYLCPLTWRSVRFSSKRRERVLSLHEDKRRINSLREAALRDYEFSLLEIAMLRTKPYYYSRERLTVYLPGIVPLRGDLSLREPNTAVFEAPAFKFVRCTLTISSITFKDLNRFDCYISLIFIYLIIILGLKGYLLLLVLSVWIILNT